MDGGQVSVSGSNHDGYVLDYDTKAAFDLGKSIAGQINSGVANKQFVPIPPDTSPSLQAGEEGEFVQTQSGQHDLPPGYSAVVDDALDATISGSTGNHQAIMAGAGNLTFGVIDGSGQIAAGAGKDSISLLGTSSDSRWNVAVGSGDDTIDALGAGAHTITGGIGNDLIRLGSGNDLVSVSSDATVIGGSGNATIFGAKGFTFIGGKGDDNVTGASVGGNSFTAGSGNETLVGGVPGTGFGTDAFTFIKGQSGGHDVIQHFTAGDIINLKGYADEIASDLANAQHSAAGMMIVLSDNTRITFANLNSLDPKSFIHS